MGKNEIGQFEKTRPAVHKGGGNLMVEEEEGGEVLVRQPICQKYSIIKKINYGTGVVGGTE